MALLPLSRRDSVDVDREARRRAVRVELALLVDDARFGNRGAPADVDDLPLAAHPADVCRESARQIDLQLERRESPSVRSRRVDRAAERRVEERGGEVAVTGA